VKKGPSDSVKKGNEIGRVEETQTERVQAAVKIAKRVIRADPGGKASPAVRVHDRTGGRASRVALAGKISRAETAVGRGPNPNADLVSLAVKKIARRKAVRAIAHKFKGGLENAKQDRRKRKG
jgi:hypothetical protein